MDDLKFTRNYEKEKELVREITENPGKYFEQLPSIKNRYLKMKESVEKLLENIDDNLSSIGHAEWLDRNSYSWKVFKEIQGNLFEKIDRDKEIWSFYLFVFAGEKGLKEREKDEIKLIKSKLPFFCKLIYSIKYASGGLIYDGEKNVVLVKYSLNFIFWSTQMATVFTMSDLTKIFKIEYSLFKLKDFSQGN